MIIKRKQTLTHWALTSAGGFGKDNYSSPSTMACRWENKQIMFRTAGGEEKISNAVIYPASSINIGDYVYLGTSTETSPYDQANAYRVENIDDVPDLSNFQSLLKVLV